MDKSRIKKYSQTDTTEELLECGTCNFDIIHCYGNFSFGTSVNFNDVTDYITNTGNSILTDNSYMEYTDQSANLQFNILRTRLLGIIKKYFIHTDFHGVNTWNNHFPRRSRFSFLSFCAVRGWL